MSLLPSVDLETLIAEHGEWCVSLYVPTHRVGDEIAQDRIQLKDQLNESAAQLDSIGMGQGDLDDLLGPIRDQLLPQSTFWQHQLDGLALFRSPTLLYAYRLPFPFDPTTVVGSRFHLKPLLPMLSGDGQFYLMTLHKDSVDVYHGTRYGFSRLEIEALPEDAESLISDRDLSRPVQWHTNISAPGGQPAVQRHAAAFHGHGVVEQHEDDDILRYYRRIDAVMNGVWHDDRAPLLLAGGADLVALYQRANTYGHLIEDASISVNPAGLDVMALHERAWEIVRPRFAAEKQAAAETYRRLQGQGSQRASSDITTVVSAAVFERVETLFVGLGVHTWGTFDAKNTEAHIDTEAGPNNIDLLDLAAIHTLLNNGTVYAVEAGNIPGGGAVAAVFRY